MKTFNDLKEGDYIYELDICSCNVEHLKIGKILPFAPNNRIIIGFDKFSLCFHKNESYETIFGVTYYCNQKDCLNELSKLIKYHQSVLKNVKRNIQKLKEL